MLRQGNWGLKCAASQDRALKLYPEETTRLGWVGSRGAKPPVLQVHGVQRGSGAGCPFFWREIWEANFLIEKRHYMPSAEGARRQARGSGVSGSSPSGVRGSAPETKHFYAF